ncbi:MAG TPA: hypothetical protein VFT74_08400 [Isosphaeraceae bacterium]|nr:hypothetical protein [Isosphaeraceae bacterium]
MLRRWEGSEAEYAIEWGEARWTLRLDGDRPGLRSGEIGPLLGLEGLSAVGRWDAGAMSGSSLVNVEERLGRIEATYVPEGWDELTLRAAWSSPSEEVIDLEVQVSTRSVGRLHAVEARVLSTLSPPPGPGVYRSVEPRDARSASFTYDGRETDLSELSTGPPGPIQTPWLAPKSGREGWTYVELVHPDDASRRIMEGRLPFPTCRYGLFGFDLERGVVLRGRLRGVWLPKSEAFEGAERHRDAFLKEPLPLST